MPLTLLLWLLLCINWDSELKLLVEMELTDIIISLRLSSDNGKAPLSHTQAKVRLSLPWLTAGNLQLSGHNLFINQIYSKQSAGYCKKL